MTVDVYELELDKNVANVTPLSPDLLRRSPRGIGHG